MSQSRTTRRSSLRSRMNARKGGKRYRTSTRKSRSSRKTMKRGGKTIRRKLKGG